MRMDRKDKTNSRLSQLHELAYRRLVDSSISDLAHSLPLLRYVLHSVPMFSSVSITDAPLFSFVPIQNSSFDTCQIELYTCFNYRYRMHFQACSFH
jgi:hypothetical protein